MFRDSHYFGISGRDAFTSPSRHPVCTSCFYFLQGGDAQGSDRPQQVASRPQRIPPEGASPMRIRPGALSIFSRSGLPQPGHTIWSWPAVVARSISEICPQSLHRYSKIGIWYFSFFNNQINLPFFFSNWQLFYPLSFRLTLIVLLSPRFMPDCSVV
jgi:hypothetical protein